MNRKEINDERAKRYLMAYSLCCEFSNHVDSRPLEIIVLLHRKWFLELERRLRVHGYRYIYTKQMGVFRIVTVVDSFR